MKTKKDEIADLYRIRDFYIHLWEKEKGMNRALWVLVGILGMVISLLFIEKASASTIELIYPTTTIQKGQEFTVTAMIIPERSNYTVSLNMCFQNAEFQGFEQDYDWIQLSVPEYWNSTTNTVERTSGFPGGFNTTTVFGTFIFKATETGFINIATATSSLIFDADNKNVFK